MQKRASGVLLHITSLASKYGIGDFGPQAYRFADFLAQAGQSCWQILPLNPPVVGISHSPYSPMSAFALNPMLVSPELLYQQGLLTRKDISNIPRLPQGSIDWRRVISYKTKLLDTAYETFKRMPAETRYQRFCRQNKAWLEDFAAFTALRQHFGHRLWCDWPVEYRDREKNCLKSVKLQMQNAINREKFLQYQLFKQWFSLKRYCRQRNIRIIGDVPIYVAHDSSDTWANPQFFKLTAAKRLRALSGVPPDSFSRTGQLWGNPVYDWQTLKNNRYWWWLQRIEHNLALFDIVRLDHFIGFVSYWQVPAGRKTAAKGKWVKGPGQDFFNKLFKRVSPRNIIVEDLGRVTADVRKIIEKFDLRPMKVLQFAFNEGSAGNCHRLYNHTKNSVVYTGTHDNNTIRGWFEKEANQRQKQMLLRYLGRKVSAAEIHWELIRLTIGSVADLVVIPMQDILGLGGEARMNLPGTVGDNWSWRLRPRQFTKPIITKLAQLTQTHGRGFV